jgi:phosphopantetheine adenylyltransferase
MEYVPELHRPEPAQMRAVRISFDFGERVMLAVHGDPLARAEARRQPYTHAKDEGRRRMQLERFMRRAAMEKDGRAEDGDLRDGDRHE